MNKKNVNKRKRYYFICSILTSIVFLAIGAYTIYAAIPSPGHGTSALEGDASLNMNSNKIINLSAPTLDSDAATKAYVDAAGGAVYEICCAWRYDYAEGAVSNGAATNWSCTPPSCYAGYTSLGISSIPSGVSWAGGTYCAFSSTGDRNTHPVSVGRSCRLCAQ